VSLPSFCGGPAVVAAIFTGDICFDAKPPELVGPPLLVFPLLADGGWLGPIAFIPPLTDGTMTGLVVVEGGAVAMILRVGLVNDIEEPPMGMVRAPVRGIELKLLMIDMSLTPVLNFGIPRLAGIPW